MFDKEALSEYNRFQMGLPRRLGRCNPVIWSWTGCIYFFSSSAYCLSIPSRITNAFDFPVALQIASNFLAVSASYRNFKLWSLGVSVSFVPFLIPKNFTSLPLWVQSNYNAPTKKSQPHSQKTFSSICTVSGRPICSMLQEFGKLLIWLEFSCKRAYSESNITD